MNAESGSAFAVCDHSSYDIFAADHQIFVGKVGTLYQMASQPRLF